MTKILLTNTRDYNLLISELKEDETTELSFEKEEKPAAFPCIAIHHYSNDLDMGSEYYIEFVYPSDFTRQ